MAEQVANFGHTLVNEPLDDSETVVTVTDGSVFPATGNFRVKVDDEIMLVTARSSNDLTVTRGAEGTTAATHADQAPIDATLTAAGISNIIHENRRGTSFPGSPASGDQYRRTDIRGGMDFRYDGTQWLSDQLFRDRVATPLQGATADQTQFAFTFPTDFDIFVTDVDWLYYLGSASATWVGTLSTVTFDESATDTVASVTVATGTYTNARWYAVRATTLGFTPVAIVTTGGNTGASRRGFRILWDEQAGASSTYFGATVEYRLIAT